MSSKINLQTCEYARKSSIFQDNQLIYTNKSANILKWVNESSDKHYHEGWDKTKTYASIVIDKKTYKVIRLYSPSPYALRSVSKEVRREQYDMVFKLE